MPRNNPANGRVNMGLVGRFELALWRQDELIYYCEQKNLVVSAGEFLAANFMFFNTPVPAEPEFIAFGTNGAAAAKSQTALLAEFAVPRVAATAGASFLADNLIHLGFTIVPTITMANVSEVGVFNAAAAGSMISRAVISPFTMTTTDSLAAVWELEFLGVD